MRLRSSRQRFWIRIGFCAAAVILLWPLPAWRNASEIPVQASPFVAVCSMAAGRILEAGFLLAIAFAVTACFRKRWFCRYVCPTGLLLEGAVRSGFRKQAWWRRCPAIGKYILILTVAGSVIGYPLFLWTDPMAIFSSAVSVRISSGAGESLLAIILLVLLLFISLISGDLWCARLCPLGAFQEQLAKVKTHSVNKKTDIDTNGKQPGTDRVFIPATRRTFISVTAGLLAGLWARRTGWARRGSAPLRPPGAVDDDVFPGVCLRCGSCIRNCPSNIIHTDTGQAGIAGLLAPVVRYDEAYCLEECNVCTQVCPSGALQKQSLDEKNRYRIGEAIVNGSLCLLVRGVNDCNICVRACPFDAVEIYWNEDLYVAYPNIDRDKCNGCGACEVYCPTVEVKAIRVWKITEDQTGKV